LAQIEGEKITRRVGLGSKEKQMCVCASLCNRSARQSPSLVPLVSRQPTSTAKLPLRSKQHRHSYRKTRLGIASLALVMEGKTQGLKKCKLKNLRVDVKRAEKKTS